jgi:hypothetical protein
VSRSFLGGADGALIISGYHTGGSGRLSRG